MIFFYTIFINQDLSGELIEEMRAEERGGGGGM
jgi:hypothetical protein